jgi:ribonuclease E
VEKVLLINADEPEEVRVALLEDGRLEELYVEAGTDVTAKGNIYVGRVQNVERGIGAAFVDLGPGLTGFLHASDIVRPVAPGEEPEEEAEEVDRSEIEALLEPEADGPRPEPPPAEAPPPPSPAPAEEAGASEPAPTDAAVAASAAPAEAGEEAAPRSRRRGRGRPIDELVKTGDLLLVQITRGPLGHKGPALSTRISLPGRYVVLLANSRRGGVSRRIDSGAERDRMRSILGDLVIPEGMAVILRTASHGRTREEVQADLGSLYRLWETLKGRLLEGGGPRLVHAESDLVLRAVRDILPTDATRIVTDDAETASRVEEILKRMTPPEPSPAPAEPVRETASPPRIPIGPEADPDDPDAVPALAGDVAVPAPPPSPPRPAEPAPAVAWTAPSLEFHPGATPLFHAFGVEAQVEDAYRRTIRLPSGGSIVIDPTEALVAIDVNSGRLTEEEDLESTALKTDLEAVPEVARQLRLRDLGGVVVVDFIDLREPSHSHQVERALKEALKRDRARIRVARMGPFGCLELTRQRIRPALASVTHVTCNACGGTGKRRHPMGIALRVLREVRSRVARSRGQGGLEVRAAPAVVEVLRKRKGAALSALERSLTGPLRLVPDPAISQGGWAMKGVVSRPPPAPASPSAPPSGGGRA